jgi:hypothetical protein
MKRLVQVVLLLLLLAPAAGARAAETLAVIAVADPPAGPDAELAELAHQLRAACRDRVGGVEDVPTMRSRLLGQTSNATLAELDRAYGGAQAVYQNGEFDSALRTLRAIVEDLESVPESEEAYSQWRRALLRLAHAAATIGDQRLADEALVKLLTVDPTYQADPDLYSPAYRRHMDELRARVRALPRRKLAVLAEGRTGAVFVNGRPFGTTPVVITLPAGAYRLGGASGSLRVPSFVVDLQEEDRTVFLDLALAEALRVNAGPGLAIGSSQRGHAIIRAGAWLGVDRLVVASRVAEGEAQFLLGSMYDVRRGSLLREGSVRMVAGSVPSVNLGALAAFLLTGQSSREVKDRTPDAPRPIVPIAAASPPAPSPAVPHAPPGAPAVAVAVAAAPPPASAPAPAAKAGKSAAPAAETAPPAAAETPGPNLRPAPSPALVGPEALPPALPPSGRGAAKAAPHPWLRPAAIGAGVVALGFGGLAIQQGISASQAYADANAMVGAGGTLVPGSDASRFHDLQAQGDDAQRNAYVAAGTAVVFAATAGVLGWMSRDGRPAEPVIRF